MPVVYGSFFKWFKGLKFSGKSGFAWLPLVGVLALVALVYPTMKYVTSPDSNFDIRQRAVIAGCEGYTTQSVCDSRGCDWYPGEPSVCNEWDIALAICTVSNNTCSQDGCTYTAAQPTTYREVCDCSVDVPIPKAKCLQLGCEIDQVVRTLAVPESCTGRYEVKGLCTGWTVATTGSCSGVPDGDGGGGGGGDGGDGVNDTCAYGEREVQYYGDCREPNYTITNQLDNGMFCCARVFASPLPTPSPVPYCSENKRDECHSQQTSCIEDLNGGYCDVYIDCNPGSRECVGTSQSRFCKPSGIWGPTSSCTSGLGCNVSTGYCISAPSAPSPVSPSPSPSPVPQCSTGTYGACPTGEQCLASPYGYYCRAVTTEYCSYENSRECGLDCTPSLYGGSCPSSSSSVDIGEGTVSQCSGYNFGICPIGQKCLSSPYGYYCRAIASPYCSHENYTKCDVDCEEDLKGGSCPVVSSWDAFWGGIEESFEGEDSPLNAYSDSNATALELYQAELEGAGAGLLYGLGISAGIYGIPLLSGPALAASQAVGSYAAATLSTAPAWVSTALNLTTIGGGVYGGVECNQDPNGEICLGIVTAITADPMGFIQAGTAAIDDVAGQVTNYADNWLDDFAYALDDAYLGLGNVQVGVFDEVPTFLQEDLTMTVYKGIQNFDDSLPILPGGLAPTTNSSSKTGAFYPSGQGIEGEPLEQIIEHALMGNTSKSDLSAWSPLQKVARGYAGSNGTVVSTEVNLFSDESVRLVDMFSDSGLPKTQEVRVAWDSVFDSAIQDRVDSGWLYEEAREKVWGIMSGNAKRLQRSQEILLKGVIDDFQVVFQP